MKKIELFQEIEIIEELERLEQISIGLQKGAVGVGKIIEKLKTIVFNLKIIAAYMNNTKEGRAIILTIEDLSKEIDVLRKDVLNIGVCGSKMGVELNNMDQENILEISTLINQISKELWSESVKIFTFLEKLRMTSYNLNIQVSSIERTPSPIKSDEKEERSQINTKGEASAISVIVNVLTKEIVILQESSMAVRDSSKKIKYLTDSIEEKYTLNKPKVYTK